ncbi:MAG: hypothetical protein GC191_01265 [Azospirillum sp.]|nr:hypothetical protein [Azospirillum sp.]
MECHAENFYQLTENLLESYTETIKDGLAMRRIVADADLQRIHELLVSFLPRLRPVFVNVCEGCPAYRTAEELSSFVDGSSKAVFSESLKQLVEFIAVLLRDRQPLSHRVFMMSIADFSKIYCGMSANGRLILDRRIMKILVDHKECADKTVYIGGGVFIFYFLSSDQAEIRKRKERMLDIILSLVGERPEPSDPNRPAEAGRAGKSLVDQVFQSDFNQEGDLKKRIEERIEGHLNALGHAKSDSTPQKPPTFPFQKIADQISIQYEPIWERPTTLISMSLMRPRRAIEPGVFLTDNAVLTRGRSDPFHYQYQMFKLEAAIGAVLEISVQSPTGGAPSVAVPFSLASMPGVNIEDFRQDLRDLIGSFDASRVVVWLEDIDEQLPHNPFVKILDSFARFNIRLFARLPFDHVYFSDYARTFQPTLVLDLLDFTRFGFGNEAVGRMIGAFARTCAVKEVSAAILNVNTSTQASMACRADYSWIGGKVIGDQRHGLSPVRELPASTVMMQY